MSSYNQGIINMLYEHQKNAQDNKEIYKISAYKRVIRNIREAGPIKDIKDVEDIDGIGKSIFQKIKDYIDSNSIGNEKDEFIYSVYGIGPAAVRKLNSEGIFKIEDLKKREDLLNEKQRIGLRYWEDLRKRIPRDEMDEHVKKIKPAMTGFEFSVVGSYRRNKESSGDIDILVLGDKGTLKDIIDRLGDYIIATLACKEKKFMGISRIGNKPARRLDILVTNEDEFPYAQLYFTGSKENNVRMRRRAKQMGYTLNEHGMKRIDDSVEEAPRMRNERDIFEYLGMEYLDPQDR